MINNIYHLILENNMYRPINNNCIYYDKMAKFNIYPQLTNSVIIELTKYLECMNTTNDINDGLFITNTNFWSIDAEKNAIIVNEYTNTVKSNIYNQLIKIGYWLYFKEYTLKGITYYRINNMVECIVADNIISHYILFDNNTNINSDDELMMFDSKQKLQTAMKLNNQWPKKFNDLTSTSDYVSDPNTYDFPLIKKESNDLIPTASIPYIPPTTSNPPVCHYESYNQNLEQRLITIESEIKFLTKTNKFLLKIFGFIALYTTSSYLLIKL